MIVTTRRPADSRPLLRAARPHHLDTLDLRLRAEPEVQRRVHRRRVADTGRDRPRSEDRSSRGRRGRHDCSSCRPAARRSSVLARRDALRHSSAGSPSAETTRSSGPSPSKSAGGAAAMRGDARGEAGVRDVARSVPSPRLRNRLLACFHVVDSNASMRSLTCALAVNEILPAVVVGVEERSAPAAAPRRERRQSARVRGLEEPAAPVAAKQRKGLAGQRRHREVGGAIAVVVLRVDAHARHGAAVRRHADAGEERRPRRTSRRPCCETGSSGRRRW